MIKWNILQAFLFQLIWFSSILGGNNWIPLSVSLLIIHFIFTPSRNKDLLMILIGGSVGFVIDLMLLKSGIYSFNEWPYWLIFLWAGFVLNFGHSLHFLSSWRPFTLAGVGCVTGPYAYWASMALSAVNFPNGTLISLVIIAGIWCLLLPFLIRIERSFGRLVNA